MTRDDPVSAMLRQWPRPPGDGEPVEVHIAWHERLAVMFDQIALNGGGNGLGASTAAWAAELERREAKELSEQASLANPAFSSTASKRTKASEPR